jgi:hypothetical protein
MKGQSLRFVVMPWLDHRIHSAAAPSRADSTEWIAGSTPAMTMLLDGFTERHSFRTSA